MIDWLVLHGGALGDLALTLHFALRLPGVEGASTLTVVSRVDPGDLSECRPSIRRVLPEGVGLHWLHGSGDDPPPERLRELVAGRRVLNALSDAESSVHRRLMSLGARAVFSFDSRPDARSGAHVTTQWQSRLEGQALLIPKCIHQHRGGVHLHIPDELRERARFLCRTGDLKRCHSERSEESTCELGKMLRSAEHDSRSSPRPSASCSRKSERASRPTAGAEPGRYIRPRQGAGRYALEHGRASRPWHPVMVHPGSGGRAKCWPLSCFIDAARRLRGSDEHVCFIAGPVEAERWSSGALDAIRSEFLLIESPAPNELLGLLAGARVVIGNDAGPAHLAALLGTPTVTIFGTTSPSVWRPLGPGARHIKGDPTSRPDNWGIDPARVAAIATSTRT
jgi:hypothetical protein